MSVTCVAPRISVVMASLNAAATIERALRSVFEQNYPDLQVICVDGGSRDGTREVLKSYAPRLDRLVIEPDRGVADALNKGFRLANGEVFCYLNADDEFAPGALWAVAGHFAARPGCDVITGSCRRVYADGSEVITTVGSDYLAMLGQRNGIEQPSTFWRAEAHRRAGEFDTSFKLAFDWEWWNRLLRQGARFARVDDVLSIYHFCDDNLTSRGGARVIDEMYRVTRIYGALAGRSADVYRFMFRWLDMPGCLDKPPRLLDWPKKLRWLLIMPVLRLVFGSKIIDGYNWNWASKQIRGLCWYK